MRYHPVDQILIIKALLFVCLVKYSHCIIGEVGVSSGKWSY